MTTGTVSGERIEERVIELLGDIGLDTDGVTSETRLRDIDVQSLDLVEVAHYIKKEHGIVLTGEDVKDVVTVGDFVGAFLSRAP